MSLTYQAMLTFSGDAGSATSFLHSGTHQGCGTSMWPSVFTLQSSHYWLVATNKQTNKQTGSDRKYNHNTNKLNQFCFLGKVVKKSKPLDICVIRLQLRWVWRAPHEPVAGEEPLQSTHPARRQQDGESPSEAASVSGSAHQRGKTTRHSITACVKSLNTAR